MKLSKLKTLFFALCAGFLFSVVTAIPVKAEVAFDPYYYAWKYADVAAVCGTDQQALFNHYQNFGMAEGRFACQQAEWRAAAGIVDSEEDRKAFLMAIPAPDPAYADSTLPTFDPIYYYNTYPDVAAAVGKDATALLKHYIDYGYSEGRYPFYPYAYRHNYDNGIIRGEGDERDKDKDDWEPQVAIEVKPTF